VYYNSKYLKLISSNPVLVTTNSNKKEKKSKKEGKEVSYLKAENNKFLHCVFKQTWVCLMSR
jgi:hypothetical protein